MNATTFLATFGFASPDRIDSVLAVIPLSLTERAAVQHALDDAVIASKAVQMAIAALGVQLKKHEDIILTATALLQ